MQASHSTKSWAQRRIELGLPAVSPFSKPHRVRPLYQDHIGQLASVMAKEIVEKIGLDVLKAQKKKKGNPIRNTMALLIPVYTGLLEKTVATMLEEGKIQKELVEAVSANLGRQTLEKMDALLQTYL